MSPSRVMVLELSNLVSFLQFFADARLLNLRPLYASESSRFAPLENVIDYYAMTKCLEDTSV